MQGMEGCCLGCVFLLVHVILSPLPRCPVKMQLYRVRRKITFCLVSEA